MNNLWPKKETYWMDGKTLCVSIPFTWRLSHVLQNIRQADMFRTFDKVLVGGPAVALMPDYFCGEEIVTVGNSMPGVLQRVNPLATKTTTGCTNKCSFCAVPKTEGEFRELDSWPVLPILCDNNLLAASEKHFDRVMNGMEALGAVDFNQGLDARLLTDYHAERIGRIKKAHARLALDYDGMRDDWTEALDKLIRHGTPKSRISSYVIVGHMTDPEECWNRCQFVYDHGVTPNPQWYHRLDALLYNHVTQRQLQLGWSVKERTDLMGWYYMHRGKPKYTRTKNQ